MFANFINKPANYGERCKALAFWRYPTWLFFFERFSGNPTFKLWLEKTSEPKPLGTEVIPEEICMYPPMSTYYFNHDVNGVDIPVQRRHAVVVPRSEASGMTFSVGEWYSRNAYLVGYDENGQERAKMLGDNWLVMTDYPAMGGPWFQRNDEPKAQRGPHDTESDSDHEQAQAPSKLQRV